MKTAWTDIFKDEPRREFIQVRRRISISNKGNYHVSYSNFRSFVIPDNYSGAITVYKASAKLFIEASFFSKITLEGTAWIGTVLYYDRTKGEAALSKVCASENIVTNNVWTICIHVTVSDNAINHFNMSSTCNCGKSTGHA